LYHDAAAEKKSIADDLKKARRTSKENKAKAKPNQKKLLVK
jgi:hypothetical protein